MDSFGPHHLMCLVLFFSSLPSLPHIKPFALSNHPGVRALQENTIRRKDGQMGGGLRLNVDSYSSLPPLFTHTHPHTHHSHLPFDKEKILSCPKLNYNRVEGRDKKGLIS